MPLARSGMRTQISAQRKIIRLVGRRRRLGAERSVTERDKLDDETQTEEQLELLTVCVCCVDSTAIGVHKLSASLRLHA